jgi:exopolyphosphatase/guanosine-5'-triphosphate,3'-diphosphate pyrophosphatase
MIRSTIDIGTNTILMLIAEYDEKTGSIKTILDIQRVPRLGKGVDSNRNILPESIQKAIDILEEYNDISEDHDSDKMTATATSFIRDSHNKDEFMNAIRLNTGIGIEILSGSDEAKWTYAGGVYDKLGSNSRLTTIDIGGGSTEITTSANPITNMHDLLAQKINGKSMNIGSVRLNEKYLKNHPPAFDDIMNAEKFINEHLKEIDFDIAGTELIGVAGTVTTLGAIVLGLDKFEADRVDGLKISIDEIESVLNRLIPMPIEELYGMGDYMTGRADIVIPGILILKCFMRKFGFDNVKVSTKGLRYGVFLRDVLNS